ETRPDPPGHRPGPRSLSAAGGRGPSAKLEQQRALLCRRGHAPHPHRQRPTEAATETRRRPPARAAAGSRPRGPLPPRRPPPPPDDFPAPDGPLHRLAAAPPVKAELVRLPPFPGLSEDEAAAALSLSRATASRYWTFARAWLIHALDEKAN